VPSGAEATIAPVPTGADQAAPPCPTAGPADIELHLACEVCATDQTVGDHHPIALEVPAWQDPEVAELGASPTDDPGASDAWPTDTVMPDSGPTTAAGFVWPLSGALTSLFNTAHPLGIDIATEAGRGIGAAADGRVVVSAYDDGYGYYVAINHSDGYVTLYAHLMAPPEVIAGEVVRRGQVIGYAGTTGRSTGPHLHFEVRLLGRLVDPLMMLPAIQFVVDPIAYRTPAAAITCPGTGPIPVQVPAGMEQQCPEPQASATPTPTPAPTATPDSALETPAPLEESTAAETAGSEATPAPLEATPPPRASTPTPTITPAATPTPRPSPTPSPVGSASPAVSPTSSPTPTPTPTPTPALVPAVTATPTPAPEPTASASPLTATPPPVEALRGEERWADAPPPSVAPSTGTVASPVTGVPWSDAAPVAPEIPPTIAEVGQLP
jgi:hypothetical protein